MAEFKDIIHTFSEYCSETIKSEEKCNGCRFHYLNNEQHVGCVDYLVRFPEDAEQFLTDWSNHRTCTMCGKVLNEWDLQENFGFEYYIGYGSKYDTEHVKARFCCACFDKMLDTLKEKCVTSPIVGEYKLKGEEEINEELVSRLQK